MEGQHLHYNRKILESILSLWDQPCAILYKDRMKSWKQLWVPRIRKGVLQSWFFLHIPVVLEVHTWCKANKTPKQITKRKRNNSALTCISQEKLPLFSCCFLTHASDKCLALVCSADNSSLSLWRQMKKDWINSVIKRFTFCCFCLAFTRLMN